MRYLKLILSEILTEHKNNLVLNITIYFTITICFFSIFVSMRVLQKNAVIYSNEQRAECTYNEVQLEASAYSSCEDIVNSLNTVKNNYGAEINAVNFNLSNNELSLLIEGLGEVSDTILLVDNDNYGCGKKEIIISKNTYYNGKTLNKGDEIVLFGEKLKVAGIGAQTVISTSAFSKFNNKALNSISVTINNISFPKPLSHKEYTDVSNIIKSVEPLVSESDIAGMKNSEVLGDQILICILISVLSVLIIVALFKQVMRNLISRIATFKLYGCKVRFIIFFFLFCLFLYILISFSAAAVVFTLCDDIFVKFKITNPISFSLELISLVLVGLLSVIFTLPGSVKLARLMPAKLEIRR